MGNGQCVLRVAARQGLRELLKSSPLRLSGLALFISGAECRKLLPDRPAFVLLWKLCSHPAPFQRKESMCHSLSLIQARGRTSKLRPQGQDKQGGGPIIVKGKTQQCHNTSGHTRNKGAAGMEGTLAISIRPVMSDRQLHASKNHLKLGDYGHAIAFHLLICSLRVHKLP